MDDAMDIVVERVMGYAHEKFRRITQWTVGHDLVQL
jgi:hypothetical protein